MSFLEGRVLVGGYDGIDVLKGCSIAVDRGEIAVIVGPNGAGKSTAMKALLGMLPLRAGQVFLDGRDITGLAPQARVKAGLAFVPQTDNVFRTMSVRENLEMGAYLDRRQMGAAMDRVFALFPVLKDKAGQLAGELSGGQRQQVAFGRALMTRPSALLLDEPTAGVSPVVMKEILARIQEIRAAGLAVLIVEQNARQALAIADRGFVMVTGETRFTGSGQDLLQNSDVRRSFLGG
jgi:branched-chain amino acid transport system ATP-binding protein